MNHHELNQPDFGTGQKKLSVYIAGVISCIILTLIAFWAVMADKFSKSQMFGIIYTAACIQLLVQIVCFLRLNTKTEQGQINVMVLLFMAVILISIIIGSLWIMYNLNYNMMH